MGIREVIEIRKKFSGQKNGAWVQIHNMNHYSISFTLHQGSTTWMDDREKEIKFIVEERAHFLESNYIHKCFNYIDPK